MYVPASLSPSETTKIASSDQLEMVKVSMGVSVVCVPVSDGRRELSCTLPSNCLSQPHSRGMLVTRRVMMRRGII